MNLLQMRAFALALILSMAAVMTLTSPSRGSAKPPLVGHSVKFAGLREQSVTSPLSPPSHLVHGFRAPLTPFGAGHRGIDLITRNDAVVAAPADGTVSFAGLVALKPVVSLTSPSGLIYSLEPACSQVALGALVLAGQRLGLVCSAGYPSHCNPEVCLHFSARNSAGYLSPQYLLGQLAPSRLSH